MTPIPSRPPVEGQDPHQVWEEYMLYDLTERIDKLGKNVEDLTRQFVAHTHEESDQYKLVSRKLDRLFAQSDEFHEVAIEFRQCRSEFKEHVDGTRKDHENARFFFRLAAWGAGALFFIATNFQVVLPLAEKLLGGHP